MKTLLLALAFAACSFAQTAAYPSAVATDANLSVARNRVQTTLAQPMAPSDTIITLTSTTGIVLNMPLVIDSEIVLVSAISPNVVVTRAFDSTVAASHAARAVVSAYITAWPINAAAAEIKAIENALGAGLSNITGAQLVASKYAFTPQSPGGSLIIGNNTITMTPVPTGVNGTDTSHALYVSGGTGTAESCTISGGAGTSGQTSGSIIINCAHTHTGAWTVQSATAGIEEASWSLAGTAGTIVVPGSSAASKIAEVYASNVAVIDQRVRTAAGSLTTGLSSNLRGGSTPEIDQSITQSTAYYLNQSNQFGAAIPSGSNLYEMDTIFAVCDNNGGGYPNAGPGIATQNACVPLKTYGQAQNANSPTWGANITATNFPLGGVTGEVVTGGDSQLTGLEVDLATYWADSPTIPKVGVQVQVGGGAVEAGPAVVIGGNGSTTAWHYGVLLGSSALYTGGTAFAVTAQSGFTPALGLDLQGTYSNAAVRIANGGLIRFQAASGNDGFVGTSGGNNLIFETPSAGTTQILNSSGAVMFQASGTASLQLATNNYVATENGANNAIACAAASGPALGTGLTVTVQLAHTLQAGANTFAYNGGSALAIKSHFNTSNNIGTAYAATGVVTLTYNGTLWMDVTQ